ncbi:hypothetical protein ACIP8U_40260 [Streptomyces pseudovenezuelae]|uniref:hypothetical protein n=1 Tax=Streptomyces TaxID=1883 RepID=UPI00131B2DD1|nr:hypothetical protein [Streptomyces sp. NRRL WC-3774]
MSGPTAVSGTAVPRDLATAAQALLLPAATLPENPHRTTPVPTPYAHPTPRAIRVRRSPR